jgi:hypothetical protein
MNPSFEQLEVLYDLIEYALDPKHTREEVIGIVEDMATMVEDWIDAQKPTEEKETGYTAGNGDPDVAAQPPGEQTNAEGRA